MVNILRCHIFSESLVFIISGRKTIFCNKCMQIDILKKIFNGNSVFLTENSLLCSLINGLV